MKSSARWAFASLAGVLLLAGCGHAEKAEKAKAENDPAVTSALGDEIMVDPELAGQQGSAGASKIEIPPEQRTPEAVAAIKAEALKLAGGTIQPAPAPSGEGDVSKLVESAATAAQIAAAAKTGKVDCAGKVQYSAKWATALPAALAVYPQGAVQEAAGTDSDGCRLRVVNFVTPVTPGDVIDFYNTRVRAGGYDARHQLDGAQHVLGGRKGAAAYLVYARKLDNGLTEVDLVASGA
jgi:hypothetical protein